MAKSRNSISSNILLIDEVFDGAADSEGLDEMMRMLAYDQKDTNTIIITHKSEMMGKTKVDRYMTANKNGNFSELTEEQI